MLEVVEQQKKILALQELSEVVSRADDLSNCRVHQAVVRERRQGNEPNAVGELIDHLGCRLQSKSCLSRSPSTGQSQHPRGALQLPDLL